MAKMYGNRTRENWGTAYRTQVRKRGFRHREESQEEKDYLSEMYYRNYGYSRPFDRKPVKKLK